MEAADGDGEVILLVVDRYDDLDVYGLLAERGSTLRVAAVLIPRASGP